MNTDTIDCAGTVVWKDVAITFRFISDLMCNVLTPNRFAGVRTALSDTFGEDGGYEKMQQYMVEWASITDEALLQELATDWTLLFGGVNPKNGPKPPYAGVWLSHDGVGIDVMCAIGQFYVDSQLGACSEGSNRLDFLGVELEYVGRLAERIAEGNTEEVAVLDRFLDRYLGSWVEAYVVDAHEKGSTAFWEGFLDLMLDSLSEVRAFAAEQKTA